MVHNIGEKRGKTLLFIYIVLALIGSSAISTGEALFFEYSNNDCLGSGGYFSSADYIIDLLAEVKIRKTNGNSNSPLRNKLLRVFIFEGLIAIAIYLAEANKKNKDYSIPIITNLVLLKLRI